LTPSYAVTTRSPVTRALGLAAGIVGLEELQPRAFVLEALEVQPLRDVAAAVQASGRPVVAVVGGLFGGGDGDPMAPLDAEDGRSALAGLLATVRGCARLNCPRLVLPVSPSMPEGLSEEGLADRLCRRLHGLATAHPGLRFLLLASTEEGHPLRPEVVRWVLDDLGLKNIGAALNQLSQGSHEEYFATLGDGLDLVLLAAGLDPDPVARACGERVPWAIRGPAT